MRLKPGRPDLGAYAAYFNVPPASPTTPLSVTWGGVTTLLLDDGSSAIMTDGFFSRPSLSTVAARRLSSSRPRIEAALSQLGVTRLEAVVPVHTHFDHAMDSAAVAQLTGARLFGGTSAALIGRGHGLERIGTVASGEQVAAGNYDITLIEGSHCPPDRFPGAITAPVDPPAKASAYKCGEAWSMLVHHRPTGQRLLIVGSAGFVPGALAGRRADVDLRVSGGRERRLRDDGAADAHVAGDDGGLFAGGRLAHRLVRQRGEAFIPLLALRQALGREVAEALAAGAQLRRCSEWSARCSRAQAEYRARSSASRYRPTCWFERLRRRRRRMVCCRRRRRRRGR